MAKARCLLAGERLGLFDALASGPREVDDLAESLSCNADGLRVLVRALVDVGVVTVRHGRVAMRARIAPDIVRFLEDEWRWLGELDHRVKHGGTDAHHAPQPDGFRERYDRALVAALGETPEELARIVPVSRSPERLLDVGGGHGLVAAAFRERYPGLHADVLDLVAPEHPVDGVQYRQGDLRTTEWGTGYDVVLLVLVLRHLDKSECGEALLRAAGALLSGGTVAIVEPRAPTARSGEGLREVFHWLASGRPAHGGAAVRGWLRDAGFRGVRVLSLASAPATILVTGFKT